MRLIFISFLWVLAGCATTPLLPPADLSAPGWHVQQGQATWKPSASRPEITGDLLLATNGDGSCFIQFSKTPFPLVSAQISTDRWQIEFGANQYAWRGHGTPPNRFGWFQLPRALLNPHLGGNWRFLPVETNFWRLQNSHTGETLEGAFFP